MPPVNGQAYWRSLDHLADTPEFREFLYREFPAGAAELIDSGDRRHFLKLMGASMALAGMGLAGCNRWPDERIAPFARRPVGRDPGVPVQYATCMELGGVASALLVTSNDGRPTKIEGNPEHPTSRGAADLLAQASVLDLYDPDRSREVRRSGEPSTWDEFARWARLHFGSLGDLRGRGLAILSEASSSPTVEALKQALRSSMPEAGWYEYEPLNNDNEVDGSRLAFGTPYRTHLHLEPARVIVALDADFIGAHRNAVAHIRDFARGRSRHDEAVARKRPEEAEMSRLYCVESDFSLTGANADVRIRLRSGAVAAAAAYLAARLLDDPALSAVERDPAAAAALTAAVRSGLDRAVEDLRRHRGESVVVAGPRQGPEVHMLVHLLNTALENVGRTVTFTPERDRPAHARSIGALAGQIRAGEVGTLVIIGGNPAYDAPAELGFAGLLEGIADTVHLSRYHDETSARCTWHVNRAHDLESWGDGRAWDGTFSVRQPLIEPLFDGHSAIELLALLTGDDLTDGHAIVRRTFFAMLGGEDERAWRRTLHDGGLKLHGGAPSGSAFTLEKPAVNRGSLAEIAGRLRDRIRAAGEGWEVLFAQHPTLYDGRFANNGWLQETPDPISKLTWDNAVLMSPASAEALGVGDGDRVTISRGERSVQGPALRVPGMADRSVTLHLGGGRGMEGRICRGAGFDVYPLRTSEAMGFASGVSIAKAGGSLPLACTQDHHGIDVNTVGGRGVQSRLRSLFREASLEEFRADPGFAAERTHVTHRLSQWSESNLDGARYAWGMTIDLTKCVGCLACVTACQAENNNPIVGKEQVIKGREMHWIRVDRYYTFGRGGGGGYDIHDVKHVSLQPVICMHCENAPCEEVCPVAATVHDKDGLNVMVYNRCVGTRYCSNNCPYKVRRFNYFDFHRRVPSRTQPGALLEVEPSYYRKHQGDPGELKRLQFNPDVTVRMRGIMEKCSYCVQRIAAGKIAAKNAYANRPEREKQALKDQRIVVADGAITPACAQTCPAEAMVFGDLMDPSSRVSKLQKNPRTYEMLEELNVKARTKYLARVRNPARAETAGEAEA